MGGRSYLLSLDQPTRHHSGHSIPIRGAVKMPMATQTVMGAGVLALAMQAAWAILGPTPSPIIIHELRYDRGYIVQDRTITSDGPFKAVWEAQIISRATGEVVKDCHGSGVWDYESGRIAPRIPLAEWVGNPLCDPSAGVYIPIATYSAGEFRIVARGEEFEVME